MQIPGNFSNGTNFDKSKLRIDELLLKPTIL